MLSLSVFLFLFGFVAISTCVQAFCDDLLAKASVHVATVQAKMAAITGRAQQKKDQ
jgi:hypothetical protein